MAKAISSRRVKLNILFSIAVQLFSLLVSVLLNLLVPKFISELEYANWQTYILYAGYAGIFHFGLLDGIMLRYSQYDYEELDKPRIRSQLYTLLFINTVVTLIVATVSLTVLGGSDRMIYFLVAFTVITKNLISYSSYGFQMTNQINKYALLIIIEKVLFGAIVGLLLILRVQDFYYFCMADIVADLIAIVVAFFMNRGFYFGTTLKLREAFCEVKTNISAGFILLISNFSSMLVVGGAKQLVDWHWGKIIFGKVSFAFSISSLFITFISAISVVLFPSLKRMEEDKLPDLYISIRNALSPFLIIVLVLYFPGAFILGLWLPKYQESLVYLAVLLPMIIYTSKETLLTNTYLKAFRKENILLWINLISVLVALSGFALAAFVFNNLWLLLIMIVVSLMARSIVAEIFVFKIINKKIIADFIYEFVASIVFIVCAKYCSLLIGGLIYLGFVILYSLVNFKKIKALLKIRKGA